MFNICLECVELFNIAVHNYDVFKFKFVHIYYTDKLYCLKLIKVKVKKSDKIVIITNYFHNLIFIIL